jgi:hypothetical protein
MGLLPSSEVVLARRMKGEGLMRRRWEKQQH